jgi:hypothetical protein
LLFLVANMKWDGEWGRDLMCWFLWDGSIEFDGQSARGVGRSASAWPCLTYWLVVQGFRRTLCRDGGHSVSAWVGQDYPKSVRCLDRWSGGDVGQSAKMGNARFWVGLGTSQILVLIINAHDV